MFDKMMFMNKMNRGERRFWLMKSEADCYSIEDLKRDRKTMWDGVRNYQVRNMMRDQMKVGDKAFFYHSNAGPNSGIVGEMEVLKGAYPDPTQFDSKSEHPDPKSRPDNPRWYCVDLKFVRQFPRAVTLGEMKLDPRLKGMAVLQKGNRLSVMPISKKHFEYILEITGGEKK